MPHSYPLRSWFDVPERLSEPIPVCQAMGAAQIAFREAAALLIGSPYMVADTWRIPWQHCSMAKI